MKIFGPLYDVAIRWSRHRRAPALLTGLSFVEGFIFPVPPEVMLAPMSLAEPRRALWFATLSLIGSLSGALVGYLLGHFAFAALQPLIEWLGWSARIDEQVQNLRQVVAESPWKAFWLLVIGWPEHGPYDAIVVTAAAPALVDALVDQLAVGGRLVAPVGGASSQSLVQLTRGADGEIAQEVLAPVTFVPLLSGMLD